MRTLIKLTMTSQSILKHKLKNADVNKALSSESSAVQCLWASTVCALQGKALQYRWQHTVPMQLLQPGSCPSTSILMCSATAATPWALSGTRLMSTYRHPVSLQSQAPPDPSCKATPALLRHCMFALLRKTCCHVHLLSVGSHSHAPKLQVLLLAVSSGRSWFLRHCW